MKIKQLVTPWFAVDDLDCTPEELLKTISLASDLIKPPISPASVRGK
jgi:hypothetical protein